MFVNSQKSFSADIEIYKCDMFQGMENKKMKLNPCLVLQQGKFYAHCKTVKDGIADLRFKQSVSRGVEQYDNLRLESELTVEEIVTLYRIVTGACQLGTQDFKDKFVEKQGVALKEKYSVKEIEKITKDAYGGRTFSNWVVKLGK